RPKNPRRRAHCVSTDHHHQRDERRRVQAQGLRRRRQRVLHETLQPHLAPQRDRVAQVASEVVAEPEDVGQLRDASADALRARLLVKWLLSPLRRESSAWLRAPPKMLTPTLPVCRRRTSAARRAAKESACRRSTIHADRCRRWFAFGKRT